MTEENPGKILIVDDNITNLHLLVSMLSKYHYEISVARSGVEALRIANISRFDLILLDIMMPDMDGFTVCEILKSSELTGDIPVIFLSALDDVTNKMKGFSIGGVDYITKPFHEEEVVARVKTHISLESTKRQLKRTIQDLREAESARIKSEEHLQTILHSLPQQIAYLSPDLQIHYVNQTGEVFSGQPSEDLIGKGIEDILPKERFDQLKPYLDRAGSGDFIQQETLIPDAEGIIHTYDAQVFPEKSGEGDIQGLFVVLTDITHHKQAEEAIHNLQREMEIVLNSIQSVIYVTDMDTYEILYANQECFRIFGDVIGKSCYSIFQKDQQGPCPFCTNEKLITRDGIPTGVYRWEFENTVTGKWYLCHDIAIPWMNGKIVRMEIATDLTEKRMNEIALKRSNHKLNLLSSITRHDVINMLTAMLGYFEIIDDMEMNPDVREFLNKQKSAALLIKHMINFTRDYQNIGYKNPIWQDVDQVLRETLMRFDIASVSLRTNLQGLSINADPLLEKVLYNLIENALRHGQHVSSITFSYEKRGDAVVIVVADDGIGIPADKKEKIFKREFYNNSGIGLFVSRDILDITGISIVECGIEGKGARFEILVPKGGYIISDLPDG